MDCDGEVLNSNPKVFGIDDLTFGTQNDFRFAIVSAGDLELSAILCTCKGEISNYYRALRAWFSLAFGGDVDCDGEVVNSSPKVLGLNGLNFATQTDFRIVIVSADDLDFSNPSYFARVRYPITTRLSKHAFCELLEAMWIAMATF